MEDDIEDLGKNIENIQDVDLRRRNGVMPRVRKPKKNQEVSEIIK